MKYLAIVLLLLVTNSYAKEIKCNTAVSKSSTIIQQLIDELNKDYSWTGGGGITNIQAISTHVYLFSISQESRIDQIEYTIEINSNTCKLTILNRKQVSIDMNKKAP